MVRFFELESVLELNTKKMHMKDEERKANNALSKKYFEVWDKFPIQRFTDNVEREWLEGLIRCGSSVLLAGSGGGREIASILAVAGRIVAVDLSEEMIQIGSNRFPNNNIEWRVGDIERLDSDLVEFDYALALGGVFCYLPEPEKGFECLFRALRPGGVLVVSVMNRQHYTEREIEGKAIPGRVRKAFSACEVELLMERVGFKSSEVRGHRFLVDYLPKEWNSAPLDEARRSVMEELLQIERRLISALPAENAKILWVIGRK